MLYVVDDAADYRFLVQQVFKLFLAQYPLRLFADGLELTRYVEQASTSTVPSHSEMAFTNPTMPRLIILDVDMPVQGGLPTLEKLKANSVWQVVPVVMMSNRLESEVRERAAQLGAVNYLLKPIGIDAMKQTMGQLCQQWLDA